MSPEPDRCLGIVGGLGPIATARLYLNVCRLVHATNKVTPAVLVDSVRMPRLMEEAFVAAVPSADSERALLGIVSAAIARLVAAGAGAVCAACNTVQPLLLTEAARCRVAAIGLVDASIAAVRRGGYRSALVLGSSSARRIDIFGDAARAQSIALTYPSPVEQAEISRTILQLTHEHATTSVTAAIASICKNYEHRVDCVLLGCTDLSQVHDQRLAERPVIDSLTELGVAAAAFLRGEA